jgi:hypothetical protein
MAQTAARRLSFSHRPSAARECFSRASPSREYPPLPRVLALSLIQRRLRLGWSPSPRPSRSPLLGGLLAPAVGVAELLLLLEFGSGLSGVPLADFRRRLLGRLRATPFPPPPLNGGSQVGQEIRVLREAPARSCGPLRHHAWFRHRRDDHVRVVRLLGDALVKKIAARSPTRADFAKCGSHGEVVLDRRFEFDRAAPLQVIRVHDGDSASRGFIKSPKEKSFLIVRDASRIAPHRDEGRWGQFRLGKTLRPQWSCDLACSMSFVISVCDDGFVRRGSSARSLARCDIV